MKNYIKDKTPLNLLLITLLNLSQSWYIWILDYRLSWWFKENNLCQTKYGHLAKNAQTVTFYHYQILEAKERLSTTKRGYAVIQAADLT